MEKIKHLTKAQHNEDFFNSFDADKTRFRDWIVVGIFYTAVHYYESYFANFNRHSRSHDICDDWILNDKAIDSTYEDYRELKQYRWHASYRSKNFSSHEIKNNILPKLKSIKTGLQNLSP